MTAQATLAQFGKSFQEGLVQAMLTDPKWTEALLEVFDPSYFDLKYLQFLSEKYFNYAKKYRVFPTLPLLVTIIKDELKVGTDTIIRDQVIDYLQRIRSNPNPGDLPYIKDKSLEFMRKIALRKALENAVDAMQADKYDTIVDGIRKAVMVGTTPSIGHEFFTDYEARFTKLQRNCVPTGLDELDRKEIFDGGLGAGEYGIVIGGTGAGKSHILTMFGANAMRQGVNVLHYTMELSEEQVGKRYDSNLCDIDSSFVIENKDIILDKYKNMKLGRLMIKYFPTNSASINTLRAHYERLVLKGFTPGIIIVDYADIMRSTRQYDSLRHELKLIGEELRGFAGEKGIGIWTASQSNKEGTDSDVIDVKNLSEAYSKGFIADVIISISRKSHEKANGSGRLYIAKNRAGRDGLVYPIKIDTARSKIEITGHAGGLEDVVAEDEKDQKAALRARWKELRSDPTLNA